MLMQIANGYIHAKGHAINNFDQTLPPAQSDLAKYIFKDPYNFSFLGTVALQNELDEKSHLRAELRTSYSKWDEASHTLVDNTTSQ